MRVLIITSTISEKSGWGRHSRAIVETLRFGGTDVSVCAESPIRETAFPLYRLKPLNGFVPFVRNALHIRRVARSFEVVHALDGWPFGVYGYAAVLGTSKKFFVNGVGTYSVAPLFSFWKGSLVRAAYRRAEAIFCISNYTKGQLVKAGVSAEKLFTVYFGVPPFTPPSFEESDAFKKKYDISRTAFPVILTVGAIKDRKGQLETLKAIEVLKERYPNILYVMVGAGNNRAYVADVKRYAADHSLAGAIRIISDANDTVLSFFYATASILALNSNTDTMHHHFEGFGAVITEAYQFGKPAVGSSDSGIEDAIQDGTTGFLTRQRDPQDIAEKIEKVLERYDFFSVNAKMRYTYFDWKKTVATYLDAYKRPRG